VETATLLTSYKGNLSGRNAFTKLGRDYIASAQAGKGQALHIWSWQKDQVHERSYTPQPLVSLTSSPDGCYCVGGAEKGAIFVWETASGRLLRSWVAHYRAVTALRFTDDGSILVSAGEDAVVAAWLLMEVLDASTTHNSWNPNPQPLHSLSQHTLPVTSICVGSGATNVILASVSLDRTCKLWSLAQGRLIRSISLPTPLHSVFLDPWEHAVYAGAGDGRIFKVSLLGSRLEAGPPPGAPQLSSSEAGLAEGGVRCLLGHTQAVNCLSGTTNGYHLVSGSEDSTLRVWDLESRQTLRVIQAKGPVTAMLVLQKPRHMMAARGSDSSGRKGPQIPQPLSVFSKQVDPGTSSPWAAPEVIIDGSQPYRCSVMESGLLLPPLPEECAPPHGSTPAPQLQQQGSADASEVQKLREDKAELEEKVRMAAKSIADLRAMNSKLHAFVVDSSVAEAGRTS
jgi:pre-rRNA-processing protein IPI3